MNTLELIGDAMLIAFGLVMVYIFGSIWITGGYQAIEPNPWIHTCEFAMGALLVILGINRFINDLKRK